jgi:hypothetical protein
MKCPSCNKEVSIPENTQRNVDSYHNTVLSITNCCGKGVYVSPRSGYTVTPYVGEKPEDNWGRKFK